MSDESSSKIVSKVEIRMEGPSNASKPEDLLF
jgi:hypothetical protein